MGSIHIFLGGQPVGKGRPRFTRQGRVYTPEKTRKYEMRLAAAGSDEMVKAGIDPVSCPVRVLVRAQFEIPKSWTKAKKARAEAMELFPGKPDADNIAKMLDALNGVVFEDDAQIYDLRVVKRYGDPCLSVRVEW